MSCGRESACPVLPGPASSVVEGIDGWKPLLAGLAVLLVELLLLTEGVAFTFEGLRVLIPPLRRAPPALEPVAELHHANYRRERPWFDSAAEDASAAVWPRAPGRGAGRCSG